jgi:hypothetical protein
VAGLGDTLAPSWPEPSAVRSDNGDLASYIDGKEALAEGTDFRWMKYGYAYPARAEGSPLLIQLGRLR